jgi:phosphatidylinositol alpha 1,6-mannosyltransferase
LGDGKLSSTPSFLLERWLSKPYLRREIDPTIRKRLKLPEDCPLILHISRLSAEKRIDVLLDAVTKMQSIGHIVLVGIGPAEATLRAQAERLHLGNRVSFLGFVSDDDLLALRRSSDVYVIPSESELQSLSTMEAMACGLPVLAANACALPELVRHNENGFLFQPGNSDQLSHYLDSMLTDTALRTGMGMESLKRIITHDRSRVLNQWEDLYTNLSIEFSRANTTVARYAIL